MKRCLLVLVLTIASTFGLGQSASQPAQEQPASPEAQQSRGRRGDGRMFGGNGIGGTITEIKGDTLTVKTMQGNTVTVKITPETRFRKDRQPAQLADFKPGDTVMVGGEKAADDTWKARFVASRTGGAQGMQAFREGMGKQFIAGEVKAIDGTKLTIARPDGQSQTIEVDENTSFRKGRESITLPDIKVGDHVFGRGALNAAGVFIPQVLNVGPPMMMMGPGERQGAPPPAKH